LALRIGLISIVLARLACPAAAAEIHIDLVSPSLVRNRLERGAVAHHQRQAAISDLLKEVGCTATEQRVDKNSANVICTLPGQTDATIMVGGHFDYAERGRGIVDDWSGASLLPSLYESLKGNPRRHTFVFVAFAAEEQGLIGSKHYVKSLAAEQKTLVRAFINLECLGLAPPKVWVHRSTPALVGFLNDVASSMHVDLQGVNVDKVGDDDTHPFQSAHIPVISIHSVTTETLPVLHSERDTIGSIQFDDYYAAYRLVAYYLAYLDVKTE